MLLKKFYSHVKSSCPHTENVDESPDKVNVCFCCIVSDLFTASKDKSLQAVDMNSGAVAHAINKAHKYVLCYFQVQFQFVLLILIIGK